MVEPTCNKYVVTSLAHIILSSTTFRYTQALAYKRVYLDVACVVFSVFVACGCLNNIRSIY